MATMTLLGGCKRAVLSCLFWLTVAPGPLRGDFEVAYVTDHGLRTCFCERELPHCSSLHGVAECDCKDHPLSWLQRAEGKGLVQRRRLSVWYSSPPHVALYLNNAEVRHLSLVRCCPMAASTVSVGAGLGAGGGGAAAKLASPEHFVVQRLEQLTVWPPTCRPGASQEMYLGMEMGAAHNEEARIAVINTAALAGELRLKAYTVRTGLDANGLLPFPNLHTLPRELPDNSSIFVTFLY